MADPISSSDNDKIVSFNIFASSALGGHVRNSKVVGVVPYSRVAANTGLDPAQLHNIVAPSLPPGSPVTYRDYNYVLLQPPGTTMLRAIGMPWIDGDITVDQEAVISVKIYGHNISEIDDIRRLLIAGGFTQVEITTTTP